MAEAPPDARRRILEALAGYWTTGEAAIAALPVPRVRPPAIEPLPPRLSRVRLPEWADDLGPGGEMLVPAAAMADGAGEPHTRVDWFYAAAWYLDGHAERAFEAAHGPIHSYALRLKGWDPALWDYAWVNRIALFLRRWAAWSAGAGEDTVCGPRPKAEIRMTHDVDAIAKTAPIRLKQAAFRGFNALRRLLRGDLAGMAAHIAGALRFLFGPADYWCFPEIEAVERRLEIRSQLNLFAGRPAPLWQFRRWLLDPTYEVSMPRLRDQLRRMRFEGWTIGLHPSFSTWRDPAAYVVEKARLEEAVGAPVPSLRQHWLRFSWAETWAAQRAAGFVEDTTLGFNDRPGFRNGAAWPVTPLGADGHPLVGLVAWPLVLMDSHLHDYGDLSPAAITQAIDRWLEEVYMVGGRVTVVWHQRILHPDYGWNESYWHAAVFAGVAAKRARAA